MSARLKILTYFLISTIIVSTLFFVVTYRYEKAFENVIERHYSERYQNITLTYLIFSINFIDSINKDWSVWDDAYIFMKTKNRSFINDNFPGNTLANLKIDYMLFFKDKKLWFGVKDRDSIIYKNPLGFIPTNNKNGFIKLNNKIFLYSAHNIIPSSGSGLKDGILVILKRLSPKRLKEAVNSIQLNNTIPKNTLRLTYQHYNFAFKRINKKHFIVLFDIHNKPIGSLSFSTFPKLLSSVHRFIIFKIVILMIISVLITVLSMYFITHFLLLKKINTLKDSIRQIDEELEFNKPVFDDKDFNSLASTIDSLVKTVKNNEYILKKIADIIPAGIVIYTDKFLYANKEAKELIGDDIVGKKVLDIFFQNDKDVFKQAIEKRIAGEEFEAEYTVQLNTKTSPTIYVKSANIKYQGRQAGLSAFIDITELNKLKEKYKRIIENLPLFVIHKLITVENNNIISEEPLYISQGIEKLTGINIDKIYAFQIWDKHSVNNIKNKQLKTLIDKGKVETESRFKKEDGSIICIRNTAIIINQEGNRYEIIVLIEDITKKKKIEILYKTLYEINNIVVKSKNEYELLKSVCNALAENNFVLAWIGYEKGGIVKPLYKYGNDNGYLDNIKITTFKDSKYSTGPTGLAHRTGRLQLNQNTMTNDTVTPFRQEALKRHFFSSASIPIVFDNKAEYTINVYSDIINFFDREFENLLEQLGLDISLAIKHLRQSKQLHYELYYDSLTGLKNIISLNRDIKRLNSCTLIYFRIKNLSTINQIYGIGFSDNMLKIIAKSIRDTIKASDSFYRIYGNKFAILIDKDMDNNDIVSLANRLKTFLEFFRFENRDIPIYIDIGVSKYPSLIKQKSDLIESVETALSKAKRTNKIEFYSDIIKNDIKRHFEIEKYIKTAIEQKLFFFHYQPILHIKTNKITKCEALIRLKDNKGNFMNPEEFISIAEKVNLIEDITKIVIETVFKETAYLDNVDVAINISAKDIDNPNLITMLKEGILQYRRTDNNRYLGNISIEITERDMIRNLQSIKTLNKELKLFGIQLEIDDFGVGYSSFDRLIEVDFDIIKIDKTLIDQISINKKAEKIIMHIIDLAHSLGAGVLAEGVETQKQFDFLKENRCDYIQGYLISKPLPFNEFVEFLKSFNG